MTEPYGIEVNYRWNQLDSTYVATLTLSIAIEPLERISTLFLSPQTMLGEKLHEDWGSLGTKGTSMAACRSRSTTLYSDNLIELQTIVGKAAVSIRAQLDAIGQTNRENALACEALNAITRSTN